MKRSAVLLISLNCNLRCPYCFAESTMGPSGFMPFATFRRAVDFLRRGCGSRDELKIRLAGGEPTLNPEFKRMLDYLKGLKGVRVQVLTNGVFSEEILREIRSFDKNRLSLLVNVNDPKRIGPKKFSIVKRNVAALSSYNLVIGINFFSPGNSWRYITDLAAEHGFKVRWSLTHPVGGDHLFVTPRDFKRVKRTVLGFLTECFERGIPTKPDCSTPLCIFESKAGVTSDCLPRSTFCNPPIVIDPELNVFLCYEHEERKLLDFKSAGAMFRHFEDARKRRGVFFWLNECRTCSYRDFALCGGGCPHHVQQANVVDLASLDERRLGNVCFHFNCRFRECVDRKGVHMLKDVMCRKAPITMDRFAYDLIKACRQYTDGPLSRVYKKMNKTYRSLDLEEFLGGVRYLIAEGYLNVWNREGRGRRQ